MSITVRFLRRPSGDSTVPTLAYSAPPAGATVSQTISVQGTAADNVSLGRVEVAVDGGPYQTATGTTSWSYSLDTTTLTNGLHTIHARAVDSAGNISAVVDRQVTVNNVTGSSLQVGFTDPSAGANVQNMLYVRGTMSSTGAAVSKVELQADGLAFRKCRILNGRWYLSYNANTLTAGAHTLTAKVTDTTGATASSAIPITVTAGTTYPGLGLIKLGGTAGYAATTNKNHFAYFIVDVGSNATDAAGRPGRHVIWSWATNMPTSHDGSDLAPSYAECLSNGWVLFDTVGQPLHYPDGISVMMDVGSVGYQNRMIDYFLNYAFPRYPGAEGVYMDNIFNFNEHLGSQTPAKYTTPNSYRDAMASFIAAFGKAMQENGKYFTGNVIAFNTQMDPGGSSINDGSQWIAWMQQLSPYMQGANYEGWMRVDSGHNPRVLGTNWYEMWLQHEQLLIQCNAYGVDLGGQMPNSFAQTAGVTYGWGPFLLDFDPQSGSAFFWGDPPAWSGTGNVWDATAYSFDVGVPLGAKTTLGTGFYRRAFSNKIVLVNANPPGGPSFVSDSRTVLPATAQIF